MRCWRSFTRAKAAFAVLCVLAPLPSGAQEAVWEKVYPQFGEPVRLVAFIEPNTYYIQSTEPGVERDQVVLRRSDDGGATWREITTFNSLASLNKYVISRTNPDLIYISRFRSRDGGKTWVDIAPGDIKPGTIGV